LTQKEKNWSDFVSGIQIPSPTHNRISVETEALIQFLIQNIIGFFVRIFKEY